jgi:hypothetical protein
MLLKVKAALGHGNWLPWLKQHVKGHSERQIRRYMRLAKTDVTSDLEES